VAEPGSDAGTADRGDLVAEDERPPLVLASGSPRRRELLAGLGLRFTVVVPDVDETPVPGEDPAAYVERLARAKADAVADRFDRGRPVVLAADTTVALAGSILGKPTDGADAAVMLRALSGRTHQVHTGVAVVGPDHRASSVTTTEVTFRSLSRGEIAAYVESDESLDKAGGYGIQGEAGRFVAALQGSASNVVGLPVAQTLALLARAGLDAVTWGPPRAATR
jgi:septum formation protein